MKLTELLLFTVFAWSAVGALGTAISLVKGKNAEAAKHAVWIVSVFSGYMVVLLLVSAFQRQRIAPIGHDQCFGDLCFAVTGVNEVPGLVAGDSDRVVRPSIRVSNHGLAAQSQPLIRAYLIDSRGRTWESLAGLSGNRLTERIAGGSQMISQPMFRVAKDSTDLGLVFTLGNWQHGRLVIGDSDSLGHRPTIVPLGRR